MVKIADRDIVEGYLILTLLGIFKISAKQIGL
jgi:hypothetical protein